MTFYVCGWLIVSMVDVLMSSYFF